MSSSLSLTEPDIQKWLPDLQTGLFGPSYLVSFQLLTAQTRFCDLGKYQQRPGFKLPRIWCVVKQAVRIRHWWKLLETITHRQVSRKMPQPNLHSGKSKGRMNSTGHGLNRYWSLGKRKQAVQSGMAAAATLLK